MSDKPTRRITITRTIKIVNKVVLEIPEDVTDERILDALHDEGQVYDEVHSKTDRYEGDDSSEWEISKTTQEEFAGGRGQPENIDIEELRDALLGDGIIDEEEEDD